MPAHDECFELTVREGNGTSSRLAVRLVAPSREATVAALYLHGFGSGQEGEKAGFFRQRLLAAGLAVCSFDFRGHGASDGTTRELTLSRSLRDLDAVSRDLESRGYRRPVIVGSSLGGLVGLWFAALHPERAAAGLHISPALGLDRSMARHLGAEAMDRWRRDGSLEVVNELGSFELGWEFAEDLALHPLARLAELHRGPALLLQSRADDRVDWREVAEFAAMAAPGSTELHLFSDGDHRLNDRLPRLWALMREFLRAHGVVGG